MTNNSQPSVESFLRERMALSATAVEDIALRAGISEDALALILEGKAKLPLNQIPQLAGALHIDAAHLLRLALQQYLPTAWPVIEAVFRQGTLTANEKLLLDRYRSAVGHHDRQPCVLNGDRVVAVVT